MKTVLLALILLTSGCSTINSTLNAVLPDAITGEPQQVLCYLPNGPKQNPEQVKSEYNQCISTAQTVLGRNGCMEAKGYRVDRCYAANLEPVSGFQIQYTDK